MTDEAKSLEYVLEKVLADNAPYLTSHFRAHLASLQAEVVTEWLEGLDESATEE